MLWTLSDLESEGAASRASVIGFHEVTGPCQACGHSVTGQRISVFRQVPSRQEAAEADPAPGERAVGHARETCYGLRHGLGKQGHLGAIRRIRSPLA